MDMQQWLQGLWRAKPRAWPFMHNCVSSSALLMPLAPALGLTSWKAWNGSWRKKVAHPDKAMVVNMSVGSPYVAAVKEAAEQAFRMGVIIVASAGNRAVDACDQSQASSAMGVLAVRATTINDTIVTFSNGGECVSLYAPVKTGALVTRSGTSFACHCATGAAALFLEHNSTASPHQVAQALTAAAVPLGGTSLGSEGLVPTPAPTAVDGVHGPLSHGEHLQFLDVHNIFEGSRRSLAGSHVPSNRQTVHDSNSHAFLAGSVDAGGAICTAKFFDLDSLF